MHILFDIGGTNMRLAFSADGETIAASKIVPTPRDFAEAVETFENIAKELSGGQTLTNAAGSIAGVLSQDRSTFIHGPNLPGWENKPLKRILEEKLDTEVFLENDCALIGLGEALYGAGKNLPIVAYITVSTGIGGTRIVNGKIDINAMGFEPGHQIIDAGMGLLPDAPGNDLEAYIGGNAIEKRLGKKGADIADKKVWDDIARFLAYGLNNTIVHWSPHIVILGGSAMQSIDIDLVRQEVRKILRIFPEPPVIVRASLGDQGGFYGALAYLRQRDSLQ